MGMERALIGAGWALMMAVGAAAQTPPPTQAPQGTPPSGQGTAPNEAEGVVVTGQRSAVRTSIDRLSYDIGTDLQSQTGSVADVLRNVPGVEVDVQGNVSLRGDGNVTILIDGRPSSAFRGEGRGEALQQFPASQIARVEVITNPNASLSPEGTAGVINLITRQNRRAGTSGSVRASIGTDGRSTAGLTASRVGQKLTVSADLGVRLARGENSESRDRARLDAASGLFLTDTTRGTSKTTGGRFRNARLAADYDLTARDRLSAELSHRGFGIDSDGRQRFEAREGAGMVNRAYDRLTDGGFDRGGTELRASWRRRLGDTAAGQEASDHGIVTDLRIERSANTRDSDARFINQLPIAPNRVDRTETEAQSDEVGAKIEYSAPAPGDAKLRLGTEFEGEQTNFDSFGAQGANFSSLITDPAQTNQFDYDITITSAFATYERPFGPVTVQGGLRVEQVGIEIGAPGGPQETNEDFSAYPSLFVAYDLTPNQRLRASYGRRIERPRTSDLNPFPVQQDAQNVRQGNPRLDPETTDSYELTYQYRRGPAFYLATLFYRDSSDGITDVVRVRSDGVFVTTRENLSQSRRAGLELIANGRIVQGLTYNVSGSLLWNEIEASGQAGATREGTTAVGRFNISWQMSPNDFLQVNGAWSGEQLLPQGVRLPNGVLNLGYRRKLNDRLSLVLTGQNLLDGFREGVELDTPTLRDRSERSFIPRAALIGFAWTFGESPNANRRRGQEPGFEFEQGGPPA